MEERNNGQSGFSYTYSAKEQAELKRIRDKYTQPPETEDKMARLYRLDASVTNTAKTVAIILGIVGTLILGFGMSLIMTELSSILGAYSDMAMVIGIAIGVLGGVLVSIAPENESALLSDIIRVLGHSKLGITKVLLD